MAQFSITATTTSAVESGSLTFRVSWDSAVAADTILTWKILFKGDLPAALIDFASGTNLTNDFTVTAGTQAGHRDFTINLQDDTVREAVQNFSIELSLGASNTNTSATIDTSNQEVDFSITDNDSSESFGSNIQSGDTDKNVLTAATTEETEFSGGSGDDSYVITRFQYGDVSIGDTFGNDNIIKFDQGVEITAIAESGNFRGVNDVTLTLSTGANIVIDFPGAGNFKFQLGNGATTDYTGFKTAIGATGSLGSIDLPNNYIVQNTVTPPDVSGNSASPPERSLAGTTNDDIVGIGTDFDVDASGASGDDAYVITRFQYGDVNIGDTFGNDNIIKFDWGVQFTAIAETGNFRGVNDVTLTLSTGADIVIAFPGAGNFKFQLGNGATTDYAGFKTALGTTGSLGSLTLPAPFTVPTPGVTPPPPGGNTAPTAANISKSLGVNENATFAQSDFSFTDSDSGTDGTFAKIKITALPSTGGVLEYNDSGTWKTLAITATQSSTDYELANGELAVADLSKLRLNPADTHTGTVSFSFKVVDGGGLASTATYTATVTYNYVAPNTGNFYFNYEADDPNTPNNDAGWVRYDSKGTSSASDDIVATTQSIAGNDLVILDGDIPANLPVVDFSAGDDIYNITSGLGENITIQDIFANGTGFDVIRFDDDVSFVNVSGSKKYTELSLPGSTDTAQLSLRVNTDVDVTVKFPEADFRFQIGDDGSLMDYDAFLVYLDAL